MPAAGPRSPSLEDELATLLVEAEQARAPQLRRLVVARLTRAQKAAELARVQQWRAMEAAYEAELTLSLADDSPESWDPPPGSPGARSRSWAGDNELPGVSEFFVPELAVTLNCGRSAAAKRARRAWTWRHGLPATFAALAAGEIDEPRAIALAEAVAHVAPELARRVEARLLPTATRLTVGGLRNRAVALLVELDPEGTDSRRTAAERAADVRVYPAPGEGMSTLAVDMPTPDALACRERADQLARMGKSDGDPRPIGQLRSRATVDLILRPWDTTRPPVTAQLTVVVPLASLAGRSEAPGEVGGQPITAAHLRELLAELDALGLRAPEGGSLTLAMTDSDGSLRATCTPEQLARLARRGCRDHPGGDCACPLLDRPPATNSYTPTDAQKLFVKTRDRTCRFPNCTRPVGLADCDHVIAHSAGGETCCTNLCCLCRSHHRLKTFAPGWEFVMDPDGTLHVTTPAGIRHTVPPPGLIDPPGAPPPQPSTGPSNHPPDRAAEYDPPPF
jgi:Domain of unknown function (DUF222)